ncbi:uncharacterized protein LOC129289502 [Prosopis cineraria]|uniref:uncharacterized protein LOC129289502 n=1 Tax=Prosopis cineraria TaxID=364024 RepID=UPI00240FEE27|nr:uncharacterized protein LOC129289502 [Prosopis cineraria]XP_054782250.1 uncharacterized protein LOC129289502 [Prosopis cineraria]
MQNNLSDLGMLPFYFVKIWPNDVAPKSRIKDAVMLFEQMDQPHFQTSQKMKRKLFEWEQEVSRLDELNCYHHGVLEKIQFQESMLENLKPKLHNFCSADETRKWRTTKSACTTEQGVDIHKLNFLMLHKTKKLCEENKLLRDMTYRQPREVAAILPFQTYNEETKNSTEAERNCTKISKQSIRKTLKGVCDELMEMRKEKKALETKMKKADKKSGAIKQGIRCLVKQRHRKEAYFCILDQRRIYDEECWVLQYRNLESVHSCMIYMDKSSSRWTGSCRNWILSNNINCL